MNGLESPGFNRGEDVNGLGCGSEVSPKNWVTSGAVIRNSLRL